MYKCFFFPPPIKGLSQCYASLHCDEYGHLIIKYSVAHVKRRRNLYRNQSRVVEFFLHVENKQQIMPNNVEAQHKRVCDILVVCIM